MADGWTQPPGTWCRLTSWRGLRADLFPFRGRGFSKESTQPIIILNHHSSGIESKLREIRFDGRHVLVIISSGLNSDFIPSAFVTRGRVT